jgi:hypothetical protein
LVIPPSGAPYPATISPDYAGLASVVGTPLSWTELMNGAGALAYCVSGDANLPDNASATLVLSLFGVSKAPVRGPALLAGRVAPGRPVGAVSPALVTVVEAALRA